MHHQPATRPPQYPPEVLWALDDCKYDPDVNVSTTNPSRPSMEKAIRHADGTMITGSEWSAIKATGRVVKSELMALPPPNDRKARKMNKTKVYFRTYHPGRWNAALDKMEQQQPLLALCASHWKADLVLGTLLQYKPLTNADNSDDDGDEDDDDNRNNGSSDKNSGNGKTKKRRLSQSTNDKGKRARTSCGGPSANAGNIHVNYFCVTYYSDM